jgi:hypothetical protein
VIFHSYASLPEDSRILTHFQQENRAKKKLRVSNQLTYPVFHMAG